jgi:hypothetical protein
MFSTYTSISVHFQQDVKRNVPLGVAFSARDLREESCHKRVPRLAPSILSIKHPFHKLSIERNTLMKKATSAAAAAVFSPVNMHKKCKYQIMQRNRFVAQREKDKFRRLKYNRLHQFPR